MALAAGGATYLLVAVFVAAIVSKLGFVRGGAASWHPVMMATDRRRRYAQSALLVAVATDAVVIVVTGVRPALAVLVASPIVIMYTAAALTAPNVRRGESRCHCIAAFLDGKGVGHLVIRN